ncbi:MAG: hypothetical protein GF344_08945 [Chitinivibrionales bacterium]|nr:hypothetical protein [Chitinivibrionales bacterium]MBD3356985.1 hypothetical protein [Chitinivibrionales bacterium]
MKVVKTGHKNRIGKCIMFTALSGMLVFRLSGESTTTAGKHHEEAQRAATASSPRAQDTKEREQRLIVYYFHTTYRCPSCNLIESLTKTAVEIGFADHLESGRIEFRSINIDTDGNKHFARDYKLYTKSVVLSDLQNGKETHWKNLEQVWKLLRNRDKFIAYIRNEVQAFL